MSRDDTPQGFKLAEGIRLDPKDRLVLLTGAARHFGHFYEKRIEGVLVLRPAQYFERRRRR